VFEVPYADVAIMAKQASHFSCVMAMVYAWLAVHWKIYLPQLKECCLMATVTLGTTAQTSLTAIQYQASVSAADFATIMQGIKDMRVAAGVRPILPDGLSRFGKLVIPNRGIIDVLPGDYVAIDGNGWPILIASQVAGSGPWVHT
jgi:hypothetical protein